MKELWVYLGNGIQASPKLLKQIKKSNSVREYKIASDAIFENIIKNNVKLKKPFYSKMLG